MDSTPAQYGDTRHVAETFGVSVKTVVMWIGAGKLRAIQPSGENGKYRIPATEIARLKGEPIAEAGYAQPTALGAAVLFLSALLLAWTTAPGVGLAFVAALGLGRLLFLVGRGVVDAERAAVVRGRRD